MKYLLMWLIKQYWKYTPIEKRKYCIFNKSCSNHVFDELKEHGTVSGLIAFYYRYFQCRSGYHFISSDKVKLADGNIIDRSELRL